MVSQASVVAKISKGFGRAANALGASCGWYRPAASALISPVAPAGFRGPVNAAFRIPNTAWTTPSNYAKPLWWGVFDQTLIAPGDYLVDPNLGTLFVGSTEPMHYPMCISCNTVLTITRPNPAAPGANHYEGDTVSDEVVLGTAWPASALNGTKGEKADISLPGDTRSAWAAILLPPSFPGQIVSGDVATSCEGTLNGMTNDAQPRRYTLSACELTGLGWRLTGALATP